MGEPYLRFCRVLLVLLPGLMLGAPVGAAPDLVDGATRQLLVEAVIAASDYDLFQARCRGDVSGRHSENLNKVLVNKFRITLIQVQDRYFPEHSYRLVQPRLQQELMDRLNGLGGCQGAKDQGLRDQLRDRYEGLLERLSGLP